MVVAFRILETSRLFFDISSSRYFTTDRKQFREFASKRFGNGMKQKANSGKHLTLVLLYSVPFPFPSLVVSFGVSLNEISLCIWGESSDRILMPALAVWR